MWALWSSSESSICSLPEAVLCSIHVLFITAAAVFWWRICLGIIEQSWHRHMGMYLQGLCEAWGDSWRSQRHWTVRTGTLSQKSRPMTNSWQHWTLNRWSWGQAKQCILAHHDRWHRSWQPKKGQVKWWNCGWSVTEVQRCLGSCHPSSGVWQGTGLGTQQLARLGSQPKQWVEHRFRIQFLLQHVDSVCLLPGRSVRSRLVTALGFSYGCPYPIRVEFSLWWQRGYLWIPGCSSGLSFCKGHLSIRWQIFGSSFPTVGR